MKKEVAQLKINKKRNFISYVEYDGSFERLIIKNLYSDICHSVEVEGITFLEWVDEYIILIQTNKKLFKYDLIEHKLKELLFLKDKIRMIISFEKSYFDYIVQLTSDVVEIKRYYFLTGTTEIIITYNLLKSRYFYSDKFRNVFIKYSHIINNISTLAIDSFKDEYLNDTLLVSNDGLKCVIKVNNKEYFSGDGFIDKAYLIRDFILFSFSNIFSESNIYKMKISNDMEIFTLENKKVDFKLFQIEKLKKIYLGKRRVPTILIEPENFNNKSMIYLHGGPDSRCKNEYKDFILASIKKGIKIYMVDYSGSIGYGKTYFEKLYNNNAEEALKDIGSVVECLALREEKYIVGESFGGYLAVQSAIRFVDKIKKAVSIGGFTDYRFQYVFSLSKGIIPKYFNVTTSKNNPIDDISKTSKIAPLVFIHGEKDIYCPLKQIRIFIENAKKITEDVKLYELKKMGHFSMLPAVNRAIRSCLIKEMM